MAPDNNNIAVLCERCRPALRLPKDPHVSRYGYSWEIFDTDFRLHDTWPGLPNLQRCVDDTSCEFCRFLWAALSRRKMVVLENPVRLGIKWLARYQSRSRHGEDGPGDTKVVTVCVLDVLVFQRGDDDEKLRLSFPIASRSRQASSSSSSCHMVSLAEQNGIFTEALAELYSRLPPPMEPLALKEGPVDFIRTSLERCAGHANSPRIVKPSTSSPEEPPPHDRRYLALSYCWGGQSQLLLTRESEQEFHTGLPREKLSPTQRDTIALAKALSIPYVWIDALCIRQNDRKDWESEAPVMGEIYSGAYLTVCAASSSSAQEGYLDREFVTPITVPVDPVSDPSGSIGGTYVFEPIMWLHDLNFTYNECGQFSLSSSDWATRAWTHQEMKMSTRLLYFTTSGMHFNCGQYIDSEYPYHIRLPDPATFMDDATTIYVRQGRTRESI
ncbi:hypothetical protein PG987_016543 [Apiospora arundinis]